VRPRLRHRRRRSSTIANAVTRRFVETSDNCDLEVLESKASPSSPSSPSLSNKPPLLFVHGSGHAAWCWAEHFMPYASSRGFDSVALSLRGRGKSGAPPPGAKAGGTLESHAEDVAAVAEMLVGEGMRPPIVVGHSFGGMVVEKLALREREREEREKEKREKETTSAAGSPSAPASGSGSASSLHSASSSASSLLSGIALLNSVPPSGNAAMIGRIAKDRGL
jgi:pimeloyl-ACP methyl ester carboxylesterase